MSEHPDGAGGAAGGKAAASRRQGYAPVPARELREGEDEGGGAEPREARRAAAPPQAAVAPEAEPLAASAEYADADAETAASDEASERRAKTAGRAGAAAGPPGEARGEGAPGPVVLMGVPVASHAGAAVAAAAVPLGAVSAATPSGVSPRRSQLGTDAATGAAGATAATAAAAASGAAAAGGSIILNVKVVEDRTFRIPFRRDGTLREFRVLVEAATGVPAANQRLIASGRILSNEDAPLNLSHESYVHLAPTAGFSAAAAAAGAGAGAGAGTGAGVGVAGTAAAGASSSAPSSSAFPPSAYVVDEEVGEPDSIIESQLATMRPGAWVTMIWFALVFWGSLTAVFGGERADDGSEVSTGTAVVDMCLGIFGVLVGNFGLRVTSDRGLAASIDRPALYNKIRQYKILLVTLAVLYVMRIMATANNVQNGGTAFIVAFYCMMVFSFCILQTTRVQRSLGLRNPPPLTFRIDAAPVVTPATTPVVAVEATPVPSAAPGGGGGVAVAQPLERRLEEGTLQHVRSGNAALPDGPGVFVVGGVRR